MPKRGRQRRPRIFHILVRGRIFGMRAAGARRACPACGPRTPQTVAARPTCRGASGPCGYAAGPSACAPGSSPRRGHGATDGSEEARRRRARHSHRRRLSPDVVMTYKSSKNANSWSAGSRAPAACTRASRCPKARKLRGQRVALFATLGLLDIPPTAVGIPPAVGRWAAIKQAHEGQHLWRNLDRKAAGVKGRLGGSMTTSKPTAQTHLFTLNVVTRSSAQHLQNVQNLWQGKIPP